MNTKTIQLFAFSFIALLLGSFAQPSQAHAGDQVLVPIMVVTDEWVESSTVAYCGKAEDTSNACQADLRSCVAGVDKIIDNAYRVCSQQKKCEFPDVTYTTFDQDAYKLLVTGPLDLFANDREVAAIKNCRNQHPKSEDALPAPVAAPTDQAAQERERDEKLRKERGEVGEAPVQAPVQAQAEPVAVQQPEAAVNTQEVAPIVPAGAAQNDTEATAGGCSMQNSKSSTGGLLGIFAILLVSVVFATLRRQEQK